MKKFLLAILMLLPSAAFAQPDSQQFGYDGTNICAYDNSASRPCVPIGALNPSAHTFTYSGPATLTAPTSIVATATVGTGTIAASSGALSNGHCVSINSSGQFVDAGGSCSVGGGGGTVNSGTIGQLAVYTGATAVGSFALGGDCVFSNPNITCTKLNGFTATLGGTLTTFGTFTTAGNLAFAGAFPVIINETASTNITLPTSGTLATTSGVATSISTAVNTAIPSATTSQLYGGSGSVGLVAPVSIGTNLNITSGVVNEVLRSYLAGAVLSNDGGSPNTVVDITTGVATSDDNTVSMALSSAYTKSIASTWVVGTGNGGLDTGAVAASTWYHVWLIERTDTGAVDVLLSTSATSPTMPTNYTKKRRVGAIKTDGASHILTFSQNGDEFLWLSPPNDINVATLGTTATLYTLSTPLGVKTNAMLRGYVQAASGTNVLINSPDEISVAASATAVTLIVWSASAGGSGDVNTRTNTSSQIRVVSSVANTTAVFSTYGWIDTRGRNN